MKYLHLSEGFNSYDPDSPKNIIFHSFVFKGGEPHIKISAGKEISENSIMIMHRINSFNDLGLLCVAVDALRRMGAKKIRLFLPYFPGARQDRVMSPGQPLTVKVYANIINGMGFTDVIIFDPQFYLFEVSTSIQSRSV